MLNSLYGSPYQLFLSSQLSLHNRLIDMKWINISNALVIGELLYSVSFIFPQLHIVVGQITNGIMVLLYLHTQGLSVWSTKCQVDSDAKTGNRSPSFRSPSNKSLFNRLLSHKFLQFHQIPRIPGTLFALLAYLSLDKMII